MRRRSSATHWRRSGCPEIALRHRLPHFNHLFTSDAYSAGYYSYLWSEVMDADTWQAFEESGNVFDPDLAAHATPHPGAGQHHGPGGGIPAVPRTRSRVEALLATRQVRTGSR
jgi:hypothetical protein